MDFIKPNSIKNIHKLSIAPMMDCTDKHFRMIMRKISSKALLYTEMIVAQSLVFTDKKENFLDFNDEEHPISIQFGGDDPKILKEAAQMAQDWGYDEINFNVGCPSPRVCSGNFGASLMKEPEKAAKCVESLKNNCNLPVTIKHRIGIDNDDSFTNLNNFVRIIANAGADRFTVHARKAILKGLNPKQNRTIPPLNYDVVKKELEDFDTVIIATGVHPREPSIDGLDHQHVYYYKDILKGGADIGSSIAIVGAGGIGFDVAEFLSSENRRAGNFQSLPEWMTEWGIGDPEIYRGGLLDKDRSPKPVQRKVYLLQRKAQKMGKNLGKTTGWIHRTALKMKGVEMISGVTYHKISDKGLYISRENGEAMPELLEVDTIVLCAGQVSNSELYDDLKSSGFDCYLIGGAKNAGELDAKRAIDQGTRLALSI